MALPRSATPCLITSIIGTDFSQRLRLDFPRRRGTVSVHRFEGQLENGGVTMLIPADGEDLGLPEDVVELANESDLVSFKEIPPGTRTFGSSSRFDLNSRRLGDYLAAYAQPQDIELAGTRDKLIRVPELAHWTVQAHAYSTDVAGKISLLGRLFAGETKVARAGVVHEAKRFTKKSTGQNRSCEFGVSVRIFAATTGWNTKLQLTLPNLAADAQLNARDARVAIDVIGYSGSLGSLLPAPERLNVESLAVYLDAFRAVQEVVFGEAGLPFLMPTLLSYEDNP